MAGREVIVAAIQLWEEAAGRKLFVEDTMRGFPVDWVYDQRQERMARLQDQKKRISESSSALSSLKATLNQARTLFDSQQAAFKMRNDALGARIDAYNERVAYWNSNGGAPDSIKAQLDKELREVKAEQSAVRTAADDVNQKCNDLNALGATYNQRVEEHNNLIQSMNTDATQFLEKVGECERLASEVRRIRIFAYANEQDLKRTLAHEFGHALGLGHVKSATSVMSAVDGDSEASLKVSNADIAELNRALSRKTG